MKNLGDSYQGGMMMSLPASLLSRGEAFKRTLSAGHLFKDGLRSLWLLDMT